MHGNCCAARRRTEVVAPHVGALKTAAKRALTPLRLETPHQVIQNHAGDDNSQLRNRDRFAQRNGADNFVFRLSGGDDGEAP